MSAFERGSSARECDDERARRRRRESNTRRTVHRRTDRRTHARLSSRFSRGWPTGAHVASRSGREGEVLLGHPRKALEAKPR
mmetsp:Transcript_5853/g.15202  ORF Transcript_5853/g.15202 Transcript_5853/m.15202 type:complete len:82 (-) Transcript_5853:920-1165(-)